MDPSTLPAPIPTSPRQPMILPRVTPGSQLAESTGSPPLTPTPTPSASQHTLVSNATARIHQVNAIRPPTPAPSPQPRSRAGTRDSQMGPPPLLNPSSVWTSANDSDQLDAFGSSNIHEVDPIMSEEELVEFLRHQINSLPSLSRQLLLTHLINDSSPAILSPLIHLITPRLKRDFLKTLPVELAFHVLSFVDEVKTLARASGVSRFWRALLEDEATWKRMCWKSGFGNAPVPPMPASPVGGSLEAYQFGRMRNLEFGTPEQWDQEDEMFTPAGRERRGTLDRVALSEFAARAELFDLPVAVRRGSRSTRGLDAMMVSEEARDESDRAREREGSWSDAPPLEPQPAEVQAAQGFVPLHTGLGFASSVISTTSEGTAERRGSRTVPSVLAQQQSNPRRRASALESSTSDLTRSLPAQHRQFSLPAATSTLVSPPMFSLPNASPSPASTTAGPSSRPMYGPLPTSSTTGFSTPLVPQRPPRASHNPFSYKTHFKRAYLTESNWLRGPGRLLSTQMSADDGVVTSLGFDEEWIVVGMATSKVHVFEAGEGRYVRTLEGHELGVWCLTLVSKGGGARSGKGKDRDRDGRDEGEDEFDRSTNEEFAAHGRSNTTFFGGSPSHKTSSSQQPRRRRSFPSASVPSSPSQSGTPSAADAQSRLGGMGLGAGGRTGDSAQQSGACSTARGWGQKGAIVVSGGCDREVRVWEVETG